nr:hypothetical protein [Myxococcota bacterium]
RDVSFSNGGTELELARESAVRRLRDVEAIVVLDTRAFGAGREARVLVTCAMAIPIATLARAGLGRDRLGAVALEGKRVVGTIERVYAKRVIATREERPEGALARDAIVTLLERGSLWKKTIAITRERLERLRLSAALAARGHPAGAPSDAPIDTLGAWLRARVETLGVESGEDLALLSEDDFLAPELPYELREALDRELPATVSVGDATYRCEYDLDRAQVLLHMTKGSRRDPPPLAYLPKFTGFRVCVETPRGMAVLRERDRR